MEKMMMRECERQLERNGGYEDGASTQLDDTPNTQ